MDKELLALIEAHPEDAKAIAKLAGAGMQASHIAAFCTALKDGKAAIEVAHKAKLAEAEKKAQELAERLSKAEAKLAKLSGLSAAPQDPGNDPTADQPTSPQALRAAFDASQELQDDFAMGGFGAYVEHLRLTGKLTGPQAIAAAGVASKN